MILNQVILVVVVCRAAIDNDINEEANVEDVVEDRVAEVLIFVRVERQLVGGQHTGGHQCANIIRLM